MEDEEDEEALVVEFYRPTNRKGSPHDESQIQTVSLPVPNKPSNHK